MTGIGAGAESLVARPNVVLIIADDLGYGDISCYGGWVETPHLDRLATEGLRYTDFHSNGAVCSPTRASIMTGMYPQRVGISEVVVADPSAKAHQLGMPAELTTLPESLRTRGYRTALLGKWHLGYYPKFNPCEHGFDLFRGYISGNVDYFSHIDQAGNFDWWHNREREDDQGYVTSLITDYADRFIRQHREEPFCVVLAHEAPHYPYQGPNDSAERKLRGEGDKVPNMVCGQTARWPTARWSSN